MSSIDDYMSQGFSRAEAKAQVAADLATTTMIIRLFRLLFELFKLFFLLMPSLFFAYLILYWLRGPLGNPKGWDFFWWMLGTVYLLECFIFLLKGWHLRLRDRDHWFWMLLWLICFLYCCVLPVFMSHEILLNLFRRPAAQQDWRGVAIVWAGAVLLGGLIFWRYRLNADTAPALFRWAFRLGRGAHRWDR